MKSIEYLQVAQKILNMLFAGKKGIIFHTMF
jgi:hypothetical protein